MRVVMLLPMSVKSKGDIVLSAFWSDILHPSGFSMLQRSKGREVAVVSRGRARRSATGLYSLVAPRLGLDYRGVVTVPLRPPGPVTAEVPPPFGMASALPPPGVIKVW
jgi:hypothetical protein